MGSWGAGELGTGPRMTELTLATCYSAQPHSGDSLAVTLSTGSQGGKKKKKRKKKMISWSQDPNYKGPGGDKFCWEGDSLIQSCASGVFLGPGSVCPCQCPQHNDVD